MKTTLLKAYRSEAYGRLQFIGGWSGWWETKIDGIWYRSERVSGFKALKDDYGNFIIDAICDRVKLRRSPQSYTEELAQCHYGGCRFVSYDGSVEQWHW